LACYSLAVVSLVACLLIERVNVKAGGFLPHLGDGEWRVMALVPAITAGMTDEEVRRERDISQLRNLVTWFGLPQYVLIPVVLVWSILVVASPGGERKRRMWVAFPCLAIGSLSSYLVLSRSYFSSLGW
jgi:uncharacterized membrane-anchored protein